MFTKKMLNIVNLNKKPYFFLLLWESYNCVEYNN